jgi:hypothetical protein
MSYTIKRRQLDFAGGGSALRVARQFVIRKFNPTTL